MPSLRPSTSYTKFSQFGDPNTVECSSFLIAGCKCRVSLLFVSRVYVSGLMAASCLASWGRYQHTANLSYCAGIHQYLWFVPTETKRLFDTQLWAGTVKVLLGWTQHPMKCIGTLSRGDEAAGAWNWQIGCSADVENAWSFISTLPWD
jgi:hypothetical protein